MSKTEIVKDILLGYGVVAIDDVAVGLTRGGSKFTVEREVRNITADGDKGGVKGRQVIDSEEAKLTVNAMEIFSEEDIKKYYPATDITGNKLTSTLAFEDGDYKTITWTGKTLAGDGVKIKVLNAINMGNIDLTLEDKNEVIPEVEFTGVYEEGARDKSTWEIEFLTTVTTDVNTGGTE